MRERIQIEQIRCERCVSRLAGALAPLKGINDARIEMGTSSVVIDYDDAQRGTLDAAIEGANFRIVERETLVTEPV
jgi:copper chaperone CopZ